MNWRRILPYRFFSQVLFFVGLAVLLASLLVGSVFTYESIARTRAQNDSEIVFLAQNIAAMAGMPILTNDKEFLDEILKLNTQFTFVDSILVVDAQNHGLSEVKKIKNTIEVASTAQNDEPKNYNQAIDLVPSHSFFAPLFEALVPPNTMMQVWHPIQPGGKLIGSIRIRYSQAEFRQQIIQQWQHTFIYAALTVGVISILLFLLLRMPMRSLLETAKFARTLNSNIGAKIEVSGGTKEFSDLTMALNSLSKKLFSQQRDLAKSAAHNQSILDNVADGIASFDEQGKVLSFNLSACEIFGYTQEEILNRPFLQLLHSDEDAQENNETKHLTLIPTVMALGEREVKGVRKSGVIFPLEIVITRTEDQEQIIYIGILRDITERQKLDRLKSEFVSTVSHELRTPLTSINGALKIVASGALGALPQKVNELVAVAVKNSQRLILMINDLLDMEKLVAGKMKLTLAPVELIEAVEQSITANENYAANYKVNYVLGEHPAQINVIADGQRLAQVLANILSNAAKFSGTSPQVDVRVVLQDNYAKVEIEDHGQGIPLDFQSEIFGAFAQANNGNTRQQGGSGLGLKISKALINDMGGEIGFTTEVGNGSTFWFTLPLVI